MRDMYVSTIKATCLVSVDNNDIITNTAPIWRKFVGFEYHKLIAWLRSRFGDVTESEMKS